MKLLNTNKLLNLTRRKDMSGEAKTGSSRF